MKRRRHVRFAVRLNSILRFEDGSSRECRVLSLSEKGLGLVADPVICEGRTNINIEIPISPQISAKLQAKIIGRQNHRISLVIENSDLAWKDYLNYLETDLWKEQGEPKRSLKTVNDWRAYKA